MITSTQPQHPHQPEPIPQTVMPAEAERGVVGSIILDPSRRTLEQATMTGLRGVDFTDRNLGRLFDALVVLIDAGKIVDATLLLIELPAMGIPRETANARTIIELTSAVANHAHCQYYAQAVHAAGKRRRVLATLELAIERLTTTEEDTATIAAELRGDLALADARPAAVETIHEGAMRAVEQFEKCQADNSGASVGLSRTGVHRLDQVIGRLRAGAMIVIGGRTGTGKTVLGVQVALTTSEHGGRALYFSMEMTGDELGFRVACSAAMIDGSAITRGNYADLPELRIAAEALQPFPFIVCDRPGITVEDIAAVSRYHHSRAPLSVVVVDYLQLVTLQPGERDRRQGLERISRQLKQLAKELEIPVVALSQLSRQAEGEKPKLSHLRETGAIEQDADMVLLLDRPDQAIADDDGQIDVAINVAKNRGGPVQEVTVKFQSRIHRFDGGAASGSEWTP